MKFVNRRGYKIRINPDMVTDVRGNEWTKESVVELLHTSNAALLLALKVLYANSTAESQDDVGMMPADVQKAKKDLDYYNEHGSLLDSTYAEWRSPRGKQSISRIGFYAGQLLAIAEDRQNEEKKEAMKRKRKLASEMLLWSEDGTTEPTVAGDTVTMIDAEATVEEKPAKSRRPRKATAVAAAPPEEEKKVA